MLLMNLHIKLLNLLVLYVSDIQFSIYAVNFIVKFQTIAKILPIYCRGGYFDLSHPAVSNPSLSAVECNPGQVVNTNVPLSPSSIIWYQQMGGDALQLGR